MKARKTRRDQKPGRYVALFHWLMNTAAWQSLGPVERSVYIELARRYAGAGSNNGRLPYSVREAADALHIGKSTALPALCWFCKSAGSSCRSRAAPFTAKAATPPNGG